MNKDFHKEHNNKLILNKRKNIRNQEISIFQQKWVLNVIIIVALLADAFTLYSIIEMYMTEKVIMSVIITVVISAGLNITPSIFARQIQDKEDKSKLKKIQLISLIAIFCILFITTFSLRWSSRENMFTDINSTIMIDGEIATTDTEEYEATMPENFLAILIGLEPLVSSIAVFTCSYQRDVNRNRRIQIEDAILDLENEKNYCEVIVNELENELQVNFDQYDVEQYDNAIQILRLYEKYLMIHCRKKLAESIGSPEAVAHLLEKEMIIKKKLGGYINEI